MTAGILAAATAVVNNVSMQKTTSAAGLRITSANFGSFTRSKFSISLWFYRNSAVTNNHVMVGFGDFTDSSSRSFQIDFGAGTSPVKFSCAATGGANNGTRQSSTTFAKDEQVWHHLLIHYDPANATSALKLRLWIDGTEETSGTYTAPTDSNGVQAVPSGDYIFIGARNNSNAGGDPFGGNMFQFAFFDNTLVSIGDVYDSGLVPNLNNISGIYSYLPFNPSGLGKDSVLVTDWTEVGTLTSSGNIPS